MLTLVSVPIRNLWDGTQSVRDLAILMNDAHVDLGPNAKDPRADVAREQEESLALIYEQRGVTMSCRQNPKPTFQWHWTGHYPAFRRAPQPFSVRALASADIPDAPHCLHSTARQALRTRRATSQAVQDRWRRLRSASASGRPSAP